ncbi:hypothetical protein [Micromonospora sp. CB01531]|uniref:hypothetical protein n=1 Tax=Micromonospora sp. CB01531 TaxID=1718947 RepID=UPI00093A28C4|nr:hypothetical protein [Micromonospora sp. CB01531]OKI52848.1 hypothetical protein A6A27_08125 [Micromonospora sp. CB01531]
MISSDQAPPGTDWLVRRIADLERQVRELQAGRRLEAATIGAGGLTIKGGGSVTVTDGGQVLIHDTAGNRMIWLGLVPFGDGTRKPGLVAFRAGGGNAALSLYDGVPAIWDNTGNIIFSSDEVSGQGIARPWLPVMWAGSDYTQWPGTTSGSFSMVLETAVPRQQPKLFVRLRHTTDLSGTTGELRLMCQGAQLGPTVTVSFAVNYTDIGPVALPAGNFGETLGLSVDGRRTAGTGAVRAMVTASWTQQS